MLSGAKKGLTTAILAKEIGLKSGRGFSGVAKKIRREISERATGGIPVEKVFWSDGPWGRATWHANAEKLKELGLIE
jgi:hypothetical protein